MDKLTVTDKIIALETAALDAWLDGNPTPYLELYSKDFTYFDPVQERLAGVVLAGCRADPAWFWHL